MDEDMHQLRQGERGSPAQPLLHGLHSRALKPFKAIKERPARTAKFCIECNKPVPIYSNYFCENHLMEFLAEEESTEEFIRTKAQFTI